MDTLNSSINEILVNPNYKDILSIIKGFRNGGVYGAKIRFPHALVMTFLFRDGSIQDKLKFIFEATYQHSKNLAFFVTIYKTLLVTLRKARADGKEQKGDSFIAGLVGGYIIFGEDNNINQQIVLYLFSRILVGMGKLGIKRGQYTAPDQTFSVFASVVWGIVMWLFRNDRDVLQGSLQASMQYLYSDSDKFDTFKNWLWHNK